MGLCTFVSSILKSTPTTAKLVIELLRIAIFLCINERVILFISQEFNKNESHNTQHLVDIFPVPVLLKCCDIVFLVHVHLVLQTGNASCLDLLKVILTANLSG